MTHLAKTAVLISSLTMAFAIASCSDDANRPTIPLDRQSSADARSGVQTLPNPGSTIHPFATGLRNPRGLKFGPDGSLYVAEGGLGGQDNTRGLCDQVLPPIGPYTGGRTARLVRISPTGTQSIVAKDLPSCMTSPQSGNSVSGVSDVAFIGQDVYVLFGGAGCSHANPDIPNGIAKVEPDGSWEMIANLSEWSLNNPVQNPEMDDYEPDGTWYSMIERDGVLYAVEPNHGEVVRVVPGVGTAEITRVVDYSAFFGHAVPTCIAAREDGFLVGNLGTFPIQEGSSFLSMVREGADPVVVKEGLTTVLGVLYDDEYGDIYVLENTTGNPFPTAATGKLLRIDAEGRTSTVASGLYLPTAMTFGPDERIYITVAGFGPNAATEGGVVWVARPGLDRGATTSGPTTQASQDSRS